MNNHDFSNPNAPASPVQVISNGRYQAAISAAGSGQSSCNGLALNRCSCDPVEDSQGYFFYLRDLDSAEFWSLGHQPVRRPNIGYQFEPSTDRCTFARTDEEIETRLEVMVSAEADLEIRRISLRNTSNRPRRIELTSYLEVVLNHAGADTAHPAFSKLFVQTEFAAAHAALLARRRPRGNWESWPWMIHALIGAGALQWETDRLRFLGRGRTVARPAALLSTDRLSGTVGNILDPVFSLRTIVELAPGASTEFAFLLGMAADRTAALGLIEHYCDRESLPLPGLTGDPPDASLAAAELPTSVRLESATSETAALGEGLRLFNGYGGFAEDGSEYVVRLPWQGDALKRPPLPWINVVANEHCGFLVSESGAGYTWARNSQANRLTPWFNDPVCDPHGEALYLRDDVTGDFWSPLPGPAPAACPYEARHGFGYSRFFCTSGAIDQETTLFVPRSDPVKIVHLRLINRQAETRRLSLFSYQRLVMGTVLESPSSIATRYDAEFELLRASNPRANEFQGAVAFALMAAPDEAVEARHFSCDRLAFIGRHGSLADPAVLRQGANLNDDERAGGDPCFAQQMRIVLAPGATLECAFLLGECLTDGQLRELASRYRQPGAVRSALEEALGFWRSLLATIRVETPAPAIDLMLNGWLVYQNLACRIWGRSAFYQSGGAYGYRDQLQDAAALAYLRPELTRAQILLHARHQFVEGDVLHWWHPEPMERGLRTRFSDDLLWLPFVICHYLRTTGDTGILDEMAPFLSARRLEPGEDETYLQPEVAAESADVYEHCCRALDRSLTRGEHGLPLMGTGDWNDGMNRVGREGRGESVWMGFFLYQILGEFLPLCERRGDQARSRHYRAYRGELQSALNDGGWDGGWYRRAYYDDGTPLGTNDGEECRIDALAQAWAVISGAAPPERAEQAMNALEAQLISERDGIIRLLTPPFVDTPHDPGYIKGYVAGVRENGGQYTHAACWVVQAVAALGWNNRAARLLEILSPVSHAATPEAAEHYKVEPYVVAADVYGAPPHVGRGGWTWYTGSAGWLYRAALESVLGLHIENGDTLRLRPCVPDDWPGYRIVYRPAEGSGRYEITVENPNGKAGRISAATLDGQTVAVVEGAAKIPLVKDGAIHRLNITLG